MNELVIFNGFSHVFFEVTMALSPLVVVFLIFKFIFLDISFEKVVTILKGMGLSLVGLSLFLQGVHVGFLPTGTLLGEQIANMDYLWLAIPIGIMLGFVATIAEPAVRILNYQVEEVSGGYVTKNVMLITISIGVALSVGLAMARVIYGIPLLYILFPGYILALILIRYSPSTFVSVAFDSGGVATGPMTVTFIMAMTVGLASGIEGRDPLVQGFGMISMVALAPILAVLILGIIFGRRDPENDEESES